MSFTADEIALAIAGDRAAVTALTRAFLPRVYGLALRLARRRDVAEEATQEAFVRVLRALPKLRDPERLDAWVLTIAANAVRELARKRPREAALEVEPASPRDLARPGTPEDERRASRERAVERALGGLEEDDRALFVLHTAEGVGLEELARERRVTPQAMKSKVHRIRARVRALALAELEAGGDGDG